MLILVIDLVNKKYEVHILVIALFKISQLFMDTLLNVFVFPNSLGSAATQLKCGGKYYLLEISCDF